MAERFPFTDYPSGWYVVGLSSELPKKGLRTEHYFGGDIVLYRTESGEFRISKPHCPHLGAHLGEGRVEGEHLRCGFHGWKYDGTGQCVRAYGQNVPKANAGVVPSMERNQMLMAWYDGEGRAPTWEPPELDYEGWTKFRFNKLSFASHPQETSENSVDFGHFEEVHTFTKAWIINDAVPDGPVLRASYGITRPLVPELAKYTPSLSVDSTFHVQVHGLGYSLVQGEIEALKLKFRHLILSTPIRNGQIHMRIASAVQKYRSRALTEVMHRVSLQGLNDEVETDRAFWESKRYVERPVLAKGDGPIHTYRKWTKQFYPGGAGRDAAPSDGKVRLKQQS